MEETRDRHTVATAGRLVILDDCKRELLGYTKEQASKLDLVPKHECLQPLVQTAVAGVCWSVYVSRIGGVRMLIKEYRIPLPLTLEEYSIAQLYMIQVMHSSSLPTIHPLTHLGESSCILLLLLLLCGFTIMIQSNLQCTPATLLL